MLNATYVLATENMDSVRRDEFDEWLESEPEGVRVDRTQQVAEFLALMEGGTAA